MTKNIEEKKEIFIQKNNEYINIKNQDTELWRRTTKAEDNIIALQEEKEKLRAKRPSLLADNEDVTELNNRLKEIDEEIEINQDTITGIKAKKKNVRWDVYNALCAAQSSYKEYIQEILNELDDKYIKLGTKFAALVKEYITLEKLRNGGEYSNTKIGYNFCIPNVKNSKQPLLEGTHHNIYIECEKEVLEKYDIPYFSVNRINYNDYL